MAQDNIIDFSFDLDFDDLDSFDALSELDAIDDDDDEAGDQVPKDRGLTFNPNPVMPDREDTRTPAQKIEALFDGMQPYRKVLLQIMTYCLEPRSTDDVFEFIHTVQGMKNPVYKPAHFCNFLERSCALWRVFEDGAPYDYTPEAETVVIDGVEYLQPAEPPAVYWLTSPEGSDYLAADDPVARMVDTLEREGKDLDVMKVVLELASKEGGTNAKELSAAVERSPQFRGRMVFSARYVDLLAKCDALSWSKGWIITDIGEQALSIINERLAPAAESDEQ